MATGILALWRPGTGRGEGEGVATRLTIVCRVCQAWDNAKCNRTKMVEQEPVLELAEEQEQEQIVLQAALWLRVVLLQSLQM